MSLPGEMMAVQLWDTTMNPSTRILKRITVEDAGQADKLLSMLMGDEVSSRKEYIFQNAKHFLPSVCELDL